MSFLPDDLKPQSIKCPNCNKYISADVKVCKFCSKEISGEARETAIHVEKEEKKKIFLSSHKSTIILGVTFLLIGIFLAFQSFLSLKFENVANINCLTPAFLIGGVVALAIGLKGYLKDR